MESLAPCVLRFALRQDGATRLFIAAAGGGELPQAAEAFRLRVALPIALGAALGLDDSRAAALGPMTQCFEEAVEGLRWIRWTGSAPADAQSASSEALEEAFSKAVGVPVFEDFPIEGIGACAKAEAASASRDGAEMARLYAALEAKALDWLCAPARPGAKARL